MFSAHVPDGNWYTIETLIAVVEAIIAEKMAKSFILVVKYCMADIQEGALLRRRRGVIEEDVIRESCVDDGRACTLLMFFFRRGKEACFPFRSGRSYIVYWTLAMLELLLAVSSIKSSTLLSI
jgi:hypothetical protein